MTVTYQVGGGGHLDIDFWVRATHLFSLYCNANLRIPSSSRTRTMLRSGST